MKLLSVFLFLAALLGADSLFNQSMKTHYIAMASIPNTATVVYSTSVWLKSIELIPQSSSDPTCVIQDGAGNIAYPTITLTHAHSYRDERTDTSPLYMSGGITWSCSDTSVKGQLIVKY